MVFYHLTKDECVESIKEKGILTKCGKNSRKCGDYELVAFLTDKKHLKLWAIFLEATHVVEVDIDPQLVTKRHFRNYYEFYTEEDIPVENIISIKPMNIKENQYQRLRKYFLRREAILKTLWLKEVAINDLVVLDTHWDAMHRKCGKTFAQKVS